ncbi:MAG: hypothetical protein KJ709_05845 [Nanoarchaeota archaeon]|nr:hypothetical protein [Nanoarchaeota archaeon]
MSNDLSNSTLAILMIVAIIVSLGSLFISLDKLSSFQRPPKVTGYAPSGSGMVNLTILAFNSINVEDSFIDLGNITPAAGVGCNVSSNSTSEPGCVQANSGTWPDNITISNDGNKNLNVTVRSSIIASSLIGGTNPEFGFTSRNATYLGGCSNRSSACYTGKCGCENMGNCSYQINFTNFAAVGTEYEVCKNLTYGGTASTRPRVYVWARVHVPADAMAVVAGNASLTFTANTPTPS